MYGEWIEQVYRLVENYLIQKIDADDAYDKYDNVEHYLMATDPNMYELYKILLKICEESEVKDNE